ncbi:hypothetical protein K431DRAFT_287924 [Polychaeton citri CBS 116435]|uniref:SWI5-dependent HO expression protein 3 n=1 Tax=Polychaeton citri CBS 116435 TaxID=1314669 RepID=A0A9P4Q4W0_9PEZI|nr:hypothetical protein K431DRAFT_287924 [Polychaeton citri CBS 116435]
MNGFTSHPSSSSPSTSLPQGNGLLSPVANGHRRTSDHTSSMLGSNLVSTSSPISPSASENIRDRESSPGATWSAIGHAGTGKSSRVIERLQSENDKLRRELKEQQVRTDDFGRMVQMYKPQIEALKDENDNLSHARGIDETLLKRRDRKIAEMTEELRVEKDRRQQAERREREMNSLKEETLEESRRCVSKAQEEAKYATNHAEILSNSHRQLSREYKSRFDGMRVDLQELLNGRANDRQKVARLEVVYEQMRQEMEKAGKVQSQMIGKWEALREANRAVMNSWSKEAKEETGRSRELSDEMDKVVNEMKWVMGLERSGYRP